MRQRGTGEAQLAWPELAIAVGLLVAAGLVLWQIGQIPVSPLYAKVGPTVFPYLTAFGLMVLAGLLLLQAWRGGWQTEEEKAVRLHWPALIFVTGGLVANVALIGSLGFTVASTVMFVLVAFALGSRRPHVDAATGLVLALVAYLGFAKALGVNIGAGLVENLLGI